MRQVGRAVDEMPTRKNRMPLQRCTGAELADLYQDGQLRSCSRTCSGTADGSWSRVVTDTAVRAAHIAETLVAACGGWRPWPPAALSGTRCSAPGRDLLAQSQQIGPHVCASYVALAELLAATLVTLDRRIALAPDLRCTVQTP